jgi:hypothetical protein
VVDPGNLAAIFADEYKMRELVRSIESIEKSTRALADHMGALERTVPTAIDKAREGTQDFNDHLRETNEHLKDMSDLAEESYTKWEKFVQSLTGKFQGLGMAIQHVGEQARRLQTDPGSLISQAIGSIPIAGPWLNVALESQFRQDRFQTAGRQAALQFQQTDRLDPNQVQRLGKELGGDMMRLEENFLAKKEEVQAVWGAFAQGGLKAIEMTKSAGFEIKGFGETLPQVALGIDKAFAQVAGTTAALSNEFRQNTNVGVAESVKLVKDLGLASHATGQNMQAFINTILQTTSALRVQGGDARDLANTYFKLQETVKGAMTSTTSGQRVSALTGAALGDLAGFVQSMPTGLKALVGQDIAAKLQVPVTDIGALRAMETGFQFFGEKSLKNEDFSKKAAEATYTRLKSEGVQSPDDMYMALKAMGMSSLLADITVRAGGKLTGRGAEDASKEYSDKLKQVSDLQPLNVGKFETLMKDLMNVVNAVGETITTVLLSILRGVLGLGEIGIKVASGDMSGLQGVTAAGALFKSIGGNLGSSLGHLGQRMTKLGIQDIGMGALDALGGREKGGSFTFIPGQRGPEAEAFAIRQAQEDILRDVVGNTKGTDRGRELMGNVATERLARKGSTSDQDAALAQINEVLTGMGKQTISSETFSRRLAQKANEFDIEVIIKPKVANEVSRGDMP